MDTVDNQNLTTDRESNKVNFKSFKFKKKLLLGSCSEYYVSIEKLLELFALRFYVYKGGDVTEFVYQFKNNYHLLTKSKFWELRKPKGDGLTDFYRGVEKMLVWQNSYTQILTEFLIMLPGDGVIPEGIVNDYAKKIAFNLQQKGIIPNHQQEVSEGRNSVEDSTDFECFFEDSRDIPALVEVLRTVDPPLLNHSGKWIGPKRGGISMLLAWWDVLQVYGYVTKPENDKILAKAMMGYFPGFKVAANADVFRQQTTTRTRYTEKFRKVVPKKPNT